MRKATKVAKASKTAVLDTAKNIYFNINEPFKNLYNIDLAEALTKVPEIGLTQSKTKVQKQKEGRETLRRIKSQFLNLSKIGRHS